MLLTFSLHLSEPVLKRHLLFYLNRFDEIRFTHCPVDFLRLTEWMAAFFGSFVIQSPNYLLRGSLHMQVGCLRRWDSLVLGSYPRFTQFEIKQVAHVLWR